MSKRRGNEKKLHSKSDSKLTESKKEAIQESHEELRQTQSEEHLREDKPKKKSFLSKLKIGGKSKPKHEEIVEGRQEFNQMLDDLSRTIADVTFNSVGQEVRKEIRHMLKQSLKEQDVQLLQNVDFSDLAFSIKGPIAEKVPTFNANFVQELESGKEPAFKFSGQVHNVIEGALNEAKMHTKQEGISM